MHRDDFPRGCLDVYITTDGTEARAGLGLTGRKCLLEEVPILGWASLSTALRLEIPPHSHEAYEIIYSARGSSDWWVGDSVYELRRGDLFLTRPGEQHGLVNAILTPSEHYGIQVEFTQERCLPGMSAVDAQSLSRALDAMQYRCFSASPDTRDCFRHILAEHRSPGPYSTMLARTTLHALLVHLIRDQMLHGREQELSHSARSSLIQEAVNQIDRQLDEPLSALGIITDGGISDSVFHRRFLAEVGLTPIEYRTQRRIVRAKAMLRENRQTVTEIALSLGFRSSQYFATVFKKETGITPGEYRSQILRP